MIDELSRSYSESRPGFKLVGIVPLALPVRLYKLRVLKMVKSPVPIGSEFVIRAISAGFDNSAMISEFLGLEEEIVSDYLAEEILAGNILVSSDSNLQLTEGGKSKLLNLKKIVLETSELEVQLDQVTKEPVFFIDLYGDTEGIFSELDSVVDSANDVIQADPLRMKRPTRADFDLGRLNKVYGTEDVKYVEVKGLTPKKFMEKLKLTWLLVFEEFGSKRRMQELVIDNALSQQHLNYVNQPNFLSSLGVTISEQQEATDLVKIAEDFDFPAEVLETLLSLRRQIPRGDSQEALGAPSPANIKVEPPGVGKFLLEKSSPSMISVYDHRIIREEALLFASKRLFIVSPWVTWTVVNRDFGLKIESLLRRGVEVTLVYGYEDGKGDDPRSIELLERLRDKGLILMRHKNTHAKILIVDNCVIFTSFNWLSFRGDPSRTYRMEEGLEFRSQVFSDFLALSLASKIKDEQI
jgi:hypothetical protein